MKGYRGALRGFPCAWEDELETPISPADAIPYSDWEIEEYLKTCHCHYCLDESPTQFSSVRMFGSALNAGRRYWGLEASDEGGRKWFVLIGSGVSPFRRDRYMRRWMLGMLPDGSLLPAEMFEAEIEDQLENDRRSQPRDQGQ